MGELHLLLPGEVETQNLTGLPFRDASDLFFVELLDKARSFQLSH
jgi:hypothetical protein